MLSRMPVSCKIRHWALACGSMKHDDSLVMFGTKILFVAPLLNSIDSSGGTFPVYDPVLVFYL